MITWYEVMILLLLYLFLGTSGGQQFHLTIGLLIEAPTGGENEVAERAAHLAYLLHACDLQPITIETYVINTQQPAYLIFEIRDFLSKTMTGFVSHVSCETLAMLNTQPVACEMLHLAVVSPKCTKADYETKDCNTFSIRERGHYILNAIVDVVEHLHWTQVVVFVDDETTETGTLTLFRMLSARFIRVKPYRLRDDVNKTMLAFKRDTTSLPPDKVPTNYLLFLKSDLALVVLERAIELNLLNRKTFWIVACYDIKVNAFFDNSPILSNLNTSNILLLRKSWNRHQKNRCSNYQIVMKPKLSLIEAYIADAVMMFANTVASVLRRRNLDYEENDLAFKEQINWEIRKQHQKLKSRVSTGQTEIWKSSRFRVELNPFTCPKYKRNSTGLFISTAFDEDGFSSNTDYEMSNIVRTAQNGVDHVVEMKVASWNRESQLKTFGVFFPNRQIGFGGVTFKVGIFLVEPYTMINGGSYTGLCIMILDELSRTLNFKYNLTRSLDRASGTEQADGSWNGLIGMTMRHEVEFSVGPFTMTKKREEAVDFTMPYAEERRGVLVKRASPSSEDAFRVIRPFSTKLWVSLVGVILLVGIVLGIINKLKSDIMMYPHETPPRDDHRLKETVWFIISQYMQQESKMIRRRIESTRCEFGTFINLFDSKTKKIIRRIEKMKKGSSTNPRTIPARLVVGFWWLFTILVSTYYTAILASSLTIPFNSKPIDSIKDLADYNCPFQPITLHHSSTYEDYKTSNIVWYKDIFERIDRSPRVTNSSFALQLVMQGDFAFIGMMSQLEYLKRNHCDKLTIIPDNEHISRVGFIFSNGSNIKHTFSRTIMKMQEAGLVEKWQKKWWSDRTQCSGSGPKKEPLTLPNVAGPYYIFLCFVAIGVLCLGFEYLVNVWKKRKKSQHVVTITNLNDSNQTQSSSL